MDDDKPEGAYTDASARSRIESVFSPLKDKPVNARKFKGSSGAVTKQLLLAALYKKGFVEVKGAGYRIDLSRQIEKTFGDNEKSNSTTEDVRVILETLAIGLKEQGKEVEVLRTGAKKAMEKLKEKYENKEQSGQEAEAVDQEVSDQGSARDDDELPGEESAPDEVEGRTNQGAQESRCSDEAQGDH